MSDFSFDLSGDHLALDFANTLGDRPSDTPVESLVVPERLVAFLEQSGTLDPDQAATWRAWCAAHPEPARALLDDARALREAIHDAFSAVSRGEPLPQRALDVLNAWWGRMVLGPDRQWRCCDDASEPETLLAPIVLAALELLTSEQYDRVRTCDSDTCGWLFLDRSRNRSRRWCDMKQCGNREKARRYYERHQHQDA